MIFDQCDGVPEHSGKAGTVEDIVSQHHAHIVFSDEFLTYYECLCQTVRRRLLGIFETDSELAAVLQKATEARQILGRGYDEYFPDSGKHEHGNRVINHRLVIYRDELLAYSLGYRIQTSTAATCQNNPFHRKII